MSMRRNRIICFLIIICLHITFFAFTVSLKGEKSFEKYSFDKISKSVGFIALTSDDEIKHISSTYVIYQDEKYSYLATSEAASKEGYEKKAYFGRLNSNPYLKLTGVSNS